MALMQMYYLDMYLPKTYIQFTMYFIFVHFQGHHCKKGSFVTVGESI